MNGQFGPEPNLCYVVRSVTPAETYVQTTGKPLKKRAKVEHTPSAVNADVAPLKKRAKVEHTPPAVSVDNANGPATTEAVRQALPPIQELWGSVKRKNVDRDV